MQFRAKALEKAREPDELDRPVVLVEPRTWTAVIVALIVTIGAGAWAAVGQLPVTVDADGFLTTSGGTTQVDTGLTGQVTAVRVRQGQKVYADTPVVDIAPPTVRAADAPRSVPALFEGEVISIDVSAGDFVSSGHPVVTIERAAGPEDPIAFVFVSPERASRIRPGTSALLSVAGYPATAFGKVRGTVVSISPHPQGEAATDHLVGGPAMRSTFPDSARALVVAVRLDRTPATASGFSWTSAKGPPMPLSTQRRVTATFYLDSRTPFDILLGG